MVKTRSATDGTMTKRKAAAKAIARPRRERGAWRASQRASRMAKRAAHVASMSSRTAGGGPARSAGSSRPSPTTPSSVVGGSGLGGRYSLTAGSRDRPAASGGRLRVDLEPFEVELVRPDGDDRRYALHLLHH